MPDRPTPATTQLADDTEYTGLDLSDLVLDAPVSGGRVWRERRFVGCTLYDADLRGLVTERCTFDDCRFRGTDLGDSAHRGSAFRSCTIERTTLSGATFTGCSLLGSTVLDSRLRPRDICTREAFENAAVVVGATGGSTNAGLHLPAMAHEAGIRFTMDDVVEIMRRTPYIADLKPGGKYVALDVHKIGGIPVVLKALLDAGLLHGDCITVTGRTLAENLKDVVFPSDQDVVYPVSNALSPTGGVVGLKGNLAPDETRLLDSALFELRMAFLEITQALARSAAAKGPGAPGRPTGPGPVRRARKHPLAPGQPGPHRTCRRAGPAGRGVLCGAAPPRRPPQLA